MDFDPNTKATITYL